MNGGGEIVVLNGAPRSGKTSIAAALRHRRPAWEHDGVDDDIARTPAHELPGIGLRPGGEHPELEPVVVRRFDELVARIAARADHGATVVVDLGLHHDYVGAHAPLWTLALALAPRRAWLIGVRCALDTIMDRREAAGDRYLGRANDGTIPPEVVRWQRAVHDPGIYDLDVHGDTESPEGSADAILRHIAHATPSAFRSIAATERPQPRLS